MAKTRTSFKKGEAKGKPKGAVNKVTKHARELFVQILEGQVDHIQDAMDKVRKEDPARYLEIYAKYAQYFVPKKTEHSGSLEANIIKVIAPNDNK